MGSGVDFHSMLGFSGLNLVFVEVWPNRCLMAVKVHIFSEVHGPHARCGLSPPHNLLTFSFRVLLRCILPASAVKIHIILGSQLGLVAEI